jgi:hypothetical protein
VEVVSVLLSAGAAVEARTQVSAVGDDEMSDILAISITGHLCTLLVLEAIWRWSLCCSRQALISSAEMR